MTELLNAALEYAERGWPIFPCNSRKEPYTDNGVMDATTDPKKIRSWWKRWPKANIALDCAGAGVMVVDFDPGHDRRELEKAVGKLPPTKLIQETPRGGYHEFYALREGEVCSNSASKLADNIDIRGFHGYVLLAPSATPDGHYQWQSEGKPAFRSEELLRCANAHRDKHEDRDNWIIDQDLPENIERAIKWLKHDARIAIEGRGGDNTAYATAAMMKSFGISPQTAFELMWEYWNPRCEPPWGENEVAHFEAKIENGYAYNTSPPGNMTEAYHVAKRKALFAPVKKEVGKGKGRKGTTVEVSPWRFFDRTAMRHIKPPAWLVPDLLTEDSYNIMFGAPRSLKTFVALDIALRVASGTSPLWLPDAEVTQGKVLFSVGEGANALNNRVLAWEAHNYTTVGLADNFFTVNPTPKVTHEIEPFIDGALEMSPDGYKLLVIDTLGRAMQGANENSSEDAGMFTAMVEELQRSLGCAVLVIGHVGHENRERVKGSMSFFADADMQLRIDRQNEEMKVLATMTKQKDHPEWDKPKLIGMHKVELASGGDSLTCCAFESQREERTPGHKKEGSTGWLVHLDLALRKALGEVKGKEYSTREIAEKLAMREDIEIGSEALRRRHLITLRETKGTFANSAYDSDKKRWRFRLDDAANA